MNLTTPTRRAQSSFGAQSTTGPSSAGADDAAYEQRKLVAALKIAQEDLAAEKAKSDHDLMNRWERFCETFTNQSGVPKNAQICIDQSSEVAQFLKTSDFVGSPHGRGLCQAPDTKRGRPGRLAPKKLAAAFGRLRLGRTGLEP